MILVAIPLPRYNRSRLSLPWTVIHVKPGRTALKENVSVAVNGNSQSAVGARLSAVDWDFPSANGCVDIHSIHPYPAKFIPEIPRRLIRVLGVQPGTAVLDPFCGCGTTLVESQAAGFSSIGVDLNPIACLISRVKTSPLPPSLLETAAKCAETAGSNKNPIIPSIPNLDHWFLRPVQEALASLLSEVASLPDLVVRDHLRLAISSIIVRVSNQDSDTRYAAIPKRVTFDDVLSAFLNACKRLVSCKKEVPILQNATVIEHDAMTLTRHNISQPVSLVITSPPYPNAYEYWLYHKYRMWWLGDDPIRVRSREIGARPNFFRKNHATAEDFRHHMHKLFGFLMQVLCSGGYVCVVIGRSKIHGKEVDNAAFVVSVAEEWSLRQIADLTRRIAPTRKSFNLSHARIKNENLLVFQRS